MNKQQQNIAIAESLGWAGCVIRKQEGLPDIARGYSPDGLHEEDIHDYTSDLNAMHEVTQTLSASQQTQFVVRLSSIVTGCNKLGLSALDISACIVHATAAQRAEAYLKTIGKWETAA